MTGKKKRKKRAPYKRRFHKPLFGIKKTTSPDGYREYMKQYMRQYRASLKKLKKKTQKG